MPMHHTARRSALRRCAIVTILGLAIGDAATSDVRGDMTPPQTTPVAAAAIPVTSTAARRQDVPIYRDALGTVQAFNTVTVRTRVDGELKQVAFTEGRDVKEGDLLAQIDARALQAALDQALAKKATDEAQLANLRQDLTRYEALVKQNYTSVKSVDTQRALVAQLEATIKGDQAAVDSASVQLDYATIRAPLSGRTGMRLVDQGNIVLAADANGLVTITQLQPIAVIFTLPEDELPAISRAMARGAVPATAMSRDGKEVLDSGMVALIDNAIDQTTGTIRLKAVFPDDARTLWPGQFINVRLLMQTHEKALTVPSAAIERGAKGLYAYVVKPDATVEARPLKIGHLDTEIAVVEAGLKEGELVVTAGQSRLQPGARVASTPTTP